MKNFELVTKALFLRRKVPKHLSEVQELLPLPEFSYFVYVVGARSTPFSVHFGSVHIGSLLSTLAELKQFIHLPQDTPFTPQFTLINTLQLHSPQLLYTLCKQSYAPNNCHYRHSHPLSE